MDTFKNFAKVTVSTGYNAAATSIALTAGHGARLPAAPFNATWWNSTDYPDPSDDPNAEIVRVTAIASDTLTVTRAQESTGATTKNTAGKTYKLIAGLTAKFVNVDLSAAFSNPDVFQVSTYGASGSPVTTTGSITTGTPTLVVASASSFQTGQGIYVAGAGAAGAELVTSISAISGTTIILAANASTTVSSVLVQHDDTVAIQNAINAAHANDGGTVLFPDGTFRINGPFDASTNSILKLPFTDQLQPPVPLRLTGTSPIPFFNYYGPVSTGGTIILSSKTGTGAWPSMLAGRAYVSGDYTLYNYVNLYIENMTWRTYDNPTISALDLGSVYNAVLINIQVDTGIGLSLVSEPIAGTCGIRMPSVGNFALAYVENSTVIGYRRGITISEHFIANNAVVMKCYHGIWVDSGFHPSWGNMVLFQCPEGIRFAGSTPVEFWVDYEIHTSGVEWVVGIPGHAIYDEALTNARGWIKYKAAETNTGNALTITTTGCQNLTLTNLHSGATSASGNWSTPDLTVRNTLHLTEGATVHDVTLGANDSGGAGKRALVIPNIVVPGPPDLNTNLLAYWKLEEASGTRIDSHGTIDLTDNNTVTSAAGKINNAAQFVAANFEYLSTTEEDVNSISGSFTVAAWVKLASKATHRFIYCRKLAGLDDYGLKYDSVTDCFQFFLYAGGWQTLNASSFGIPAIDTWYYIISGYDADLDQIHIQVNGGAVDTLAITLPLLSPPDVVFHIGIYSIAEGSPWDGMIDEVAFWQRVLTPAEKTSLYNSGSGVGYPFGS